MVADTNLLDSHPDFLYVWFSHTFARFLTSSPANLVSTYAQNEQNFNAVERVRSCHTSFRYCIPDRSLGSTLYGATIGGRYDDAE